MRKLFIAEEPDIGRALAAYLWNGQGRKYNGYIQNSDTTITWAFGHILGLDNLEAYGDEFKSWLARSIIQKMETKIYSNCS